MSASKKKQQRREAVDVEKVTEAQAKQAAYKKKARLYTIIGIVVAVLVVVLLVWNSGIFQKNATAATIGDDKLSVAELSFYYYDVRQMYAQYGMIDSNMNDAETVLNSAEGTTYQDYFLEQALSDAQRYHVLYEDALKEGRTAADVKDSVDAQIANLKASAKAYGYDYKAFLKALYGRYATPALVEKMLTKSAVADQYYSSIGSDKLESYTTEELEAYYNEHADDVDTITYSYLYFRAETGDTTGKTDEEIADLKEAAMEAAKADAEQALEYYEGDMEVSVLIEKTAPSTSADHTSSVGVGSISSTYSEELLALEPEQAAIVESEGLGYYVVIFHSKERNETKSANVRHILIQAANTTDASGKAVAPTEEAWATALAEIEKIKAEYESGAQTGEAFAALANKYSKDGGSNTNGGLYEQVTKDYFVTEFDQWLFAEEGRNNGDVALIRHEGDAATEQYPYWGYHLTYFEGWDETEWELYVRQVCAQNYMDEWMNGLCEVSPAALASASNNVGR